MYMIHYSPAKDSHKFAGECVSFCLFATLVDTSVVSSYKPSQKRNNNLTPDNYPKPK